MRSLVIALALLLAACTAPQNIGDEYRNVPRTNFTYADNAYRIFDKPSAGKLIITPSVANAMSDSLLRKVTFGTYGNAVPQTAIEAAVTAYLASSGRRCATDSAKPVGKPQWEFDYTCEITYTLTD